MRNFWDVFTAKLGGKKLFDTVEKYDLARDIRMTVVTTMKFDSRCKFLISALPIPAMEEHDPEDCVRLIIHARHLPPWWAGTFADNLRNEITTNGYEMRYGLALGVMFATTPINEMVDRYFPERPRLIGVVPNRRRIIEFCKEHGIARTDIEPYGIQAANGLIMKQDKGRFYLPRRCYDIVPGTESEPAKEQYIVV